MKNLVTSGCSFSADAFCWPVHLAKDLNVENHYQLGKSSAGNDYINRSVLRKISNLLANGTDPKDIYVAIMWSGEDRFSHYFNNEQLKGRHRSSFVQPLKYPDGDDNGSWLLTNAGFDNKFTKTYYKYYHNPVDMSIKTYERILSTQIFLEKYNIKYVFSCYKNRVLDYVPTAKIHFEHFEREINWTRFVKDACYEWCKTNMLNDFKRVGDDHPSRIQHQEYAKKVLLPFIESDLK